MAQQLQTGGSLSPPRIDTDEYDQTSTYQCAQIKNDAHGSDNGGDRLNYTTEEITAEETRPIDPASLQIVASTSTSIQHPILLSIARSTSGSAAANATSNPTDIRVHTSHGTKAQAQGSKSTI